MKDIADHLEDLSILIKNIGVTIRREKQSVSITSTELNAAQLRYITINKFSEITGYTKAAIHKKISDGVWIEGRIFHRAPDKRIMIDTVAFEKWVVGKI